MIIFAGILFLEYICAFIVRKGLVVSEARHIIIALACSLLGVFQFAGAQTSVDSAVSKLVEAGYMNVRTYEDNSELVISLENDRYKLQASGLANAIKLLSDEGLVAEDRKVTIIATYYGVPEVSLTYIPALHRWMTSYRLEGSWDKVRKEECSGKMFGRTDLVIYPQVSLMNLIITQVYQSLWDLNPTVEAHLWKGAALNAQIKIPVINDGYGRLEGLVHPGQLTLSQRFRVPYNVNLFGKATIGTFSNNRYGAALELFYPFPNERFSLESKLGLLGLYYWEGFTMHIGREQKFYWSFGASYYWPMEKTQFSLKLEKFLLDDIGVKYEMTRHFCHCSIGFYAEKGFYSDTRTNGGFRFMISLPPYGVRRYRRYPKVTTGSMGMTYNANNEQRWYKEWKTEYGDNIMSKNAFNPYFIDSEIVKINF